MPPLHIGLRPHTQSRFCFWGKGGRPPDDPRLRGGRGRRRRRRWRDQHALRPVRAGPHPHGGPLRPSPVSPHLTSARPSPLPLPPIGQDSTSMCALGPHRCGRRGGQGRRHRCHGPVPRRRQCRCECDHRRQGRGCPRLRQGVRQRVRFAEPSSFVSATQRERGRWVWIWMRRLSGAMWAALGVGGNGS